MCNWLRPAGATGGAYLLSGTACPCCGVTCPVGLATSAIVGGLAALALRCYQVVRSSLNKIIKTKIYKI